MDFETGKESLYFSLDNIHEKCYHYSIPTKLVNEDTTLLGKITDQINQKMAEDNIKIFYSIYSSDYDKPLCYVTAKSAEIQE
jgi:hypothetical protein